MLNESFWHEEDASPETTAGRRPTFNVSSERRYHRQSRHSRPRGKVARSFSGLRNRRDKRNAY